MGNENKAAVGISSTMQNNLYGSQNRKCMRLLMRSHKFTKLGYVAASDGGNFVN